MFAAGKYEHPQYGELDFSRERLARIKQNFDQRVRKIDIALDSNHDQNQATGWVERMELREAQPGGAPAGLWGLIRWTPLGVQLLKDQVYRYFSPEFVDAWTDPQSGATFDDVLLGGGLTNRPFLKELTPVQLAEKDGVSRRPWGEVKKSQLPRSAFLDQGDPDHVDSWRLPVYEGAGTIGPDGKYTQRGPLNINGVRAALDALGGAHTGSAMTGAPAGVRAKLERWLAQYGGDGEGKDSRPKQAGEEAGMAGKRGRSMAAGAAGADSATDDERDEMLAEGGDDGEEYAENDEENEALAEPTADDPDGDGDNDTTPEGDTDHDVFPAGERDRHAAMTTDGHSHGKFGRHSHSGDADHSEAPLKRGKGAGKGKAMSEEREQEQAQQKQLREAEHVRALTEKVAALEKQLHEQQTDKQLAEWGGQTFTLSEKTAEGKTAKRSGSIGLSKAFRDKYRAFALSEGFAMGEARFAKVNELLSTLLSDGLVDLSRRSNGSFEQDERSMFGEAAANDPEARSKLLSDRTRELAREIHHKELRELPHLVVAELQRQAAKEIGY